MALSRFFIKGIFVGISSAVLLLPSFAPRGFVYDMGVLYRSVSHHTRLSPLAYAQTNTPPKTGAESAKIAEDAEHFKFDTTQALPGSFGSKQGSGGSTLNDVVGRIIQLTLQLLATVGIAVCVFGAVKMVLADGDSAAIKKGQQAFLNGVIGTILVLVSYVLVAFVRDFILKINGS